MILNSWISFYYLFSVISASLSREGLIWLKMKPPTTVWCGRFIRTGDYDSNESNINLMGTLKCYMETSKILGIT